MKRWDSIFICAFAAVALIACGLFVPAHLRAVDERVLDRAGKATPALTDRGLAFARQGNIGAAKMLLQAAREQKLSGVKELETAISEASKNNPPGNQSAPFTEFAVRSEIREMILGGLQTSSNRVTLELLKLRALTNTVLFPPSESASGQAIDAAISICGGLVDGRHVSPVLSGSILTLASRANRGGDSQAIEEVLMDTMSLGQRFDWGQLTAFVGQIKDTRTLHVLSEQARRADAQLPLLFSAVILSGSPAAVAKYLETFSQTGFNDLRASLRFGAGGVSELVRRNQRLHAAGFGPPLLLDWSLRRPWFALSLKWVFYLGGGFLLAMALHFARRVPALERPLQVRGFHFAREFLFALGFLLVVLLVSEPFLAQESQKTGVRFQLRLSTVGGVVPAGPSGANVSFMNPEVLLTMLLFFVLQLLLYVACVLKLAEIRRQRVAPRMKLKLLENEDHLFDAGLYLGFFGTIISLILVSLGVFKQPSLMAAYSATSFGILFVSFFKICHLRPARRKLLMEADVEPREEAVAPGQTFAVS